MWNIRLPSEAEKIIGEQIKKSGIKKPKNLEEQAIMLVGKDIYDTLVKGYTEKQWGRQCKDLPPSIIKRIPLRFTYDNNYFNDIYQGIPRGGYSVLINELLRGADVILSCEYRDFMKENSAIAEKTVYTGRIDELFDYVYGELEYRSLDFEWEELTVSNYQGCAVVNYTDSRIPYTRIIEHKHFEKTESEHTVITREYPRQYSNGCEPYYPINDSKNNALYQKYKSLADKMKNFILGGRLAEYKYYDMDKVIASSIEAARREFGG
jgi:UDP-galactopyranose mutase